MKYLVSGRIANAVFLFTFVVGSAIALLLFTQGASAYRSQELNHAQQHLQQFVARYDVALQQTVERSSKLAQAIKENNPLAATQFNQFIQLVYPKPQDVAEINWLKNAGNATTGLHFSTENGLSAFSIYLLQI